MLEGLIRLRPALLLLLLLLNYCWGPGHCRVSEDEGRVAPLSQLRSQVSSVEELLEEFRQQLQQQSEPLSPVDAHNQQGESLRTGVTQAVHYLQQEGPEDATLARRMHGEGRDPGELEQTHTMHLGAESHLQVPGDEQGLRHLQQMQEEGRQQLGEDGCEGRFSTLQGYIIRTKDSLGAGATFLTAPGGVSSWHQCLGACCEEPRCSVAVVELSTSSSRQSAPALSCYLFDCIYKGGSVCTFSEHLGYNSFTSLRVNASAHRLGEPARSSKRKLPLTTEQEGGNVHWAVKGNSRGAQLDPEATVSQQNEIDEPPRSNAGQDVVLRLPTDWAHLDGRESIDDHGIIRYEWNLLHGDPSLDMKEPVLNNNSRGRLLHATQPGGYFPNSSSHLGLSCIQDIEDHGNRLLPLNDGDNMHTFSTTAIENTILLGLPFYELHGSKLTLDEKELKAAPGYPALTGGQELPQGNEELVHSAST